MNIRECPEYERKSAPTAIYNPALLLDSLLRKFRLSNDKALARLIGVTPSLISKIRTGKNQVSAGMLIRVTEIADVGISDIRALIGERRTTLPSQDDFINRGRRAGD